MQISAHDLASVSRGSDKPEGYFGDPFPIFARRTVQSCDHFEKKLLSLNALLFEEVISGRIIAEKSIALML